MHVAGIPSQRHPLIVTAGHYGVTMRRVSRRDRDQGWVGIDSCGSPERLVPTDANLLDDYVMGGTFVDDDVFMDKVNGP